MDEDLKEKEIKRLMKNAEIIQKSYQKKLNERSPFKTLFFSIFIGIAIPTVFTETGFSWGLAAVVFFLAYIIIEKYVKEIEEADDITFEKKMKSIENEIKKTNDSQ